MSAPPPPPAASPALASPPSPRARWIFIGVLVPIHLVWVAFTVGLRVDHFVMDGVSSALFFMGPRVERFAGRVIPLWLVGALYETLLPTLMPYRGAVHVADLHGWELALFGIGEGTSRLLPTEWITRLLHPVLDVICGITYLLYLPQTFVFAGFLYATKKAHLGTLLWGFLLLNVLGQTTWVLFPAAPPWYVEQYGLGPAVMNALPSAARAARFDTVMGVQLFHGFYSRSVNVFGAMPSLHCAYPTLVLLVTIALRRATLIVPAALFLGLMCFSAVYLNHHYVLDVLVGVLYGAISFTLVVVAQRRLDAR